jgi:hypothetical protein
MFDPLSEGYLPPEECAARMQISVEQVGAMVRTGVLRATRDGLWIQPAIVSGAIE